MIVVSRWSWKEKKIESEQRTQRERERERGANQRSGRDGGLLEKYGGLKVRGKDVMISWRKFIEEHVHG